MKTCFVALITVTSIYTGCVFISVYTFGDSIKSDVLTNIGDNQGWDTIVLCGLFSIIACLHVPLIFYVGKDALLIMIFTFFYVKSENKEKVQQNLKVQANRSKSLQMSTIRLENLSDFENERNTCDAHNLIAKLARKRRDVIPNIDKCIANQVMTLSNANVSGITMNEKEEEHAHHQSHNEFNHNDLPIWIYLLVTFGLYGSEITIASLVDDVSIVFGFIGALAISMLLRELNIYLFFILPGTFYIRSVYLWCSDKPKDSKRLILAWIYLIFGFIVMFGGLASVYANIKEGGE